MGIRDVLKKKDRIQGEPVDRETANGLAGSEFTILRSDTHTQEVIYPPSHLTPDPGDHLAATDSKAAARPRRSLDVFRPRSRDNSVSSAGSDTSRKDGHRRLSHRLHLSRHPSTSEYVPENLPQIKLPVDGSDDKDATELQWENRATILAQENEKIRNHSVAPSPSRERAGSELRTPSPARKDGVVSSKVIDEDIQQAIQLHESGELEQSTQMFGRLANPQGANNPLSQVLYGLALRSVGFRPMAPDRATWSTSNHAGRGLPSWKPYCVSPGTPR